MIERLIVVVGKATDAISRRLSRPPLTVSHEYTMRRLSLLLFLTGLVIFNTASAFDHSHRVWNDLLSKHVQVSKDGNSSVVRYSSIQAERPLLKRYLTELSDVSMREYGTWTKPQQLAFLINAYNAFTVDLVLSKYPGLNSINDLGNVFQSPWKKKFFVLLGEERSLDDLEHGLIRSPGQFNEPRIHFAVVCASIGCPMLRPESFVAERLEYQLADGMRRFLADRSRNRFDAKAGRMQVSKIFDWYGKDFGQGHQGLTSLKVAFARHADVLGANPDEIRRIRDGAYSIEFLDYDWRLNDGR